MKPYYDDGNGIVTRMLAEGSVAHFFVAYSKDNQCARCGREREYIRHTQEQPPLPGFQREAAQQGVLV